MGLGPGTNNYVELMALKLLFIFAGGEGVKPIQIFGDSMLVINWIRKSQICHNIVLIPLLDEVFKNLDTFDSFVQHVYRERNSEEYSLSKVGLNMDYGKWMIIGLKDDSQHEFYHGHFIYPPFHADISI
jgi:hypothetical protein